MIDYPRSSQALTRKHSCFPKIPPDLPLFLRPPVYIASGIYSTGRICWSNKAWFHIGIRVVDRLSLLLLVSKVSSKSVLREKGHNSEKGGIKNGPDQLALKTSELLPVVVFLIDTDDWLSFTIASSFLFVGDILVGLGQWPLVVLLRWHRS